MSDPWNPDQYRRFGDERSRPFWDLAALVRPQPAMRIVDLGCGTGELTRQLHDRLRAAETIGIDNSPTMLAQATAHAGNGVRFVHSDIRAFADRSGYDLVFSNAALQFVEDHETLFVRLRDALRPAGQLAIHVPANHDHPSQTVAAEVAGTEPFRTLLGGYVRQSPVLPPERYATLLYQLGFVEQKVHLGVYGSVLASRDEVVEWVKGGALTEYQRRLAPADFQRFLVAYRDALLPRLDDDRPYFFPFKRILLWARCSDERRRGDTTGIP